MPCHYPLQAVFAEFADGTRKAMFPDWAKLNFRRGISNPPNVVSVPCGRCMGCKLERSRQWAVRQMHESKMHSENCFVTLTFAPEHLPTDGSLCRKHMQDFMKRLRKKFSDRKIRYFLCGEYGDRLGRPHYHICLFGLHFVDRKVWKQVDGFVYYNSVLLSDLWPFGHSCVADFNFETAAYVARYCTKKVSGSKAEEHYDGRLPEFCQMSLKPGIGRSWIDKYGSTDVWPHDNVVVRGRLCKPPRYYDKILEQNFPARMIEVKQARLEQAAERADDNTHRRLLVKEKCMKASISKLIRKLERA